MITLNRVGDSITGTVNGVRFGIHFDQTRFDAMLALQKEAVQAVSVEALTAILADFDPYTRDDYSTKVQSACPDIYVAPSSGKFYLKYGTVVSSIAIPDLLARRILESVEKGIDASPLIKAWIRFLRNPNFTPDKAEKFATYIMYQYIDRDYVAELMNKHGVSEEVAVERATVTQTPITQEGLLSSYKVSKELTERYILDDNGNKKAVKRYTKQIDENTGLITYNEPEFAEDRIFEPAIQGQSYNPFTCQVIGDTNENYGHVIKVGHIHALKDWSQVDTNDNRSHCPGLHIGNIDYIRNYQNSGTVTHNVFVDPAHIGAITHDGSGALRVLSYFVHSTLEKVNRGIYHSSRYAQVTDAQWEVWKAEAIKVAGADSDLKASDLAELTAL